MRVPAAMYLCLLFCVRILSLLLVVVFFFFNDTATTEIYTLSLHDALPIFRLQQSGTLFAGGQGWRQIER
mgnify:CR=1 FL=1